MKDLLLISRPSLYHALNLKQQKAPYRRFATSQSVHSPRYY